MMFYISIAICISLAIIDYFEFDWVMRYSKYNFKRYSLKAQRIVFACLGCIAIIPMVIVKIVDPADYMFSFHAVIANLAILTVYMMIIRGVSQQAIKKVEAKKKIIELRLSNNNDLQYVKKELKSWYNISISTKQIEKISKQINCEKLLEGCK